MLTGGLFPSLPGFGGKSRGPVRRLVPPELYYFGFFEIDNSQDPAYRTGMVRILFGHGRSAKLFPPYEWVGLTILFF